MNTSKQTCDPEQYYDAQASFYDDCRSDYYRYYEQFSVLSLLPKLSQKAVLDVACGSGLYTRLFESLGAARVTGVDVSQGMLEQARNKMTAVPSIIEYIHSDICTWVPDSRYDLVFSTYILNYACDRATLESMVSKLAECVEEHGKLILTLDILGYRRASEYGQNLEDFSIYHETPLLPYDRFRLTLKSEHPEGVGIELAPCHIDLEELLQLLAETGFADISLKIPSFSPEAAKHIPASDIACITAYPPLVLISATRRKDRH